MATPLRQRAWDAYQLRLERAKSPASRASAVDTRRARAEAQELIERVEARRKAMVRKPE